MLSGLDPDIFPFGAKMLYLKPRLLGNVGLDDAVLKADKKACAHCGPCGVGEHALYLNTIRTAFPWKHITVLVMATVA